MENASKALLIAGGVLIAILIIGLLINSFSTISEFQMSQLSQQEQEELIAFNEQYTKYVNQYVYGLEVRTLINKFENDNLVEVKLEPTGVVPPTGVGQDVQYYKCMGITYDNLTGRVNSITFKKIEISSED